MKRIPIGISHCLLGEAVRYDGDHQRNEKLVSLQDILEYRGICPEVSAGLGVPRDPIRLIKAGEQIRALQYTSPPRDVTEALVFQAELTVAQHPDICGYIFMQRSPSCGLFTVKQFNDSNSLISTDGRGVYARQLAKLMPLIPMEEAGRLSDRRHYENFLVRVAVLRDWKHNIKSDAKIEELRQFYERYRYQVMAQHLFIHVELEHLLASDVMIASAALKNRFIGRVMLALGFLPTHGGNVRTLRYLRDQLKRYSNRIEQINLSRMIEAYQHKQCAFSVPLAQVQTLLSRDGLQNTDADQFWHSIVHRTGINSFVFTKNPSVVS